MPRTSEYDCRLSLLLQNIIKNIVNDTMVSISLFQHHNMYIDDCMPSAIVLVRKRLV